MSNKSRFRHMWELADLCQLPTLGGWTRKVSELEQHRANWGTVNEGGEFFVQSGRKPDPNSDRALDFFAALSFGPKGNALIVAAYCTPVMVQNYPGVAETLRRFGVVEETPDMWRWSDRAARGCGSYTRAFWKRAQRKRPRLSA